MVKSSEIMMWKLDTGLKKKNGIALQYSDYVFGKQWHESMVSVRLVEICVQRNVQ